MNALDYLEWRGDIGFDYDPFNLVDNLLLSLLSYIDFSGIIPEEGISLKDAYEEYIKVRKIETKRQSVFPEMAKAKRFSDLLLHHYASGFNVEKSEQFAALMIDLPDKSTYVSYRGTDGTAVGWKEDFMMLYKEVDAQKSALSYLNTFGRYAAKIRVGGHSKGGNLALYAAMKADRTVQRKIVSIFSNDGPGLGPEVYNESEYRKVADRYLKIVPDDDVFGQAFNHECRTLIVKTDNRFLFAHNALSWQVKGNVFVKAEELRKETLAMRDAFEEFLTSTTLEQREYFTNALFEALREADIQYSKELINPRYIRVRAISKALKSLSEMDESGKEVAGRFLKVFTSYFETGIGEFLGKSISMLLGGKND